MILPTRIHLNLAATLSYKPGPPQTMTRSSIRTARRAVALVVAFRLRARDNRSL